MAGWLHEENLSEHSRNQETQQLNETRAQLVEGECSHHYDNPALSLAGLKDRLLTRCYYLRADTL